MRFTQWFSRRMPLRKGASDSTSTGVVIAVAGVALALMVMELTLAVVAGFKHEIERKVMGFDGTVTVLPPYDYERGEVAQEMEFTDDLARVIARTFPEDARIVEQMRRHAILKTDSDFIAVECVAYGEGHSLDFERGNIVRGVYPSDETDIMISERMARQLGLDTASRAYLYYIIDGQPKVRRGTVSGVYNSNFGEYDATVVYTGLPMLQGVGNNHAAIGSVGIEGVGYSGIDRIVDDSRRLQAELVESYRRGEIDGVYQVTNVAERGVVFLSWLSLLDTNVIVIFILMVCVAAFTLISSLFIIILDRVATIGILRSLGASRATVSRIFVNVTLRIVGLGLIIGNVLGLGVILLQKATHFIPLNPEMYYLDSVPVELSWWSVLWLNIGVMAGAWLILILPARLAAHIDPASSMRYE